MVLKKYTTQTGTEDCNSWVLDIEADGLYPSVIHCAVLRNVVSNQVKIFFESNKNELQTIFNEASCVIGHNIIDYDLFHIGRLWSITLPNDKVIDTLILSHLLNYNIEDGHSLKAWGERLGVQKVDYTGGWQTFNEDMLNYCIADTLVNFELFIFLRQKLFNDHFKKAIEVEHQVAFICREMTENGFTFNYDGAKNLYKEILEKVNLLDEQILKAFPPKIKFVREVTPRLTKFGTLNRSNLRKYGNDLSMFQEGCTFSEIEYEVFNPGSPKQIVERLNEAGWKPFVKTKAHLDAEKSRDKEKLLKLRETGWKVNEDNLATLPDSAPEGARKLVERILLASRLRTLDEWFSAYDYRTKSIHGQFRSIGTWTHRMSHQKPNMGNVAASKSIKYKGKYLNDLATSLGGRMRSLWIADLDEILVGTDAEGIQLRILAHYLNDKDFTFAVTQGKKEDGTDPHSLNQRALGPICKTRDNAKTFIYAFILGAGVGKIAEILGCTTEQANEAIDNFIRAYPGLKTLKENTIPRDARRGYFEGLDGRYVVCDSEHLMLAGYLQNGEATIMKHANVLWRSRLNDEGVWFKQVNFVHDEWQTKVRNSLTLAEKVGKIQAQAITDVGVMLNLNCPLSGSSSYGYNWLETH